MNDINPENYSHYICEPRFLTFVESWLRLTLEDRAVGGKGQRLGLLVALGSHSSFLSPTEKGGWGAVRYRHTGPCNSINAQTLNVQVFL